MALMAGHTTVMIYEKNSVSSLIDNKEGVLSVCETRSALTEQPILLFLMVDKNRRLSKCPQKQFTSNWKHTRREKMEILTG